MKLLLVLFACITIVCSTPQTYDSRYDDFDAQVVADNPRLLKSYGNCFLGAGPCTSEGADFKKTIPEALKTNCAKCSRKQRQLIRTVVRGFQTKTPDLWEKLAKQEDPTGQYKQSFNAFINGSD